MSSNDSGVGESKASGIVSWDDNGFATGADNGFSGTSMVGWSFKAGSTVTNNDGDVESQVSVNKDMGFSVVRYPGLSVGGVPNSSTVGHGLGKPPVLIIQKCLTADIDWNTTGDVIGWSNVMWLNNPSQALVRENYWNETAPNAETFTLGHSVYTNNGSGPQEYITYCFTNTEMLQVGSYVGNGLDDGPMVSLPMKPAFTMIKSIDGGGGGKSWCINDNIRLGYNPENMRLRADTSGIEDDSGRINYLSNGFKVTSTYPEINESGKQFLYLAIAEQNFKHARGR